MSEQPKTRQELYDLIRQTSKADYIYKEMVRLGFWKADNPRTDISVEIKEMDRINKRLSILRGEQSKLGSTDKLIKEARKKRLLESRKKQQETKDKREKERIERAAAWAKKQEESIVFLGANVSAGLQGEESNTEALAGNNLPVYHKSGELANAMGVSVNLLRYLAFDRKVSTVNHYTRFLMPKKSGGTRLISAPKPKLKAIQLWIYETLLKRVPLHNAAHGFVPGRSIVTNAREHVGSDVVVNLDLSNFFPTITYRRVKGLFRFLGYSEALATILGLICTEPAVTDVEVDLKEYHVATSERFLPQGAPTSPAITNILCRRLDERLSSLAKSLGFRYTRYADDLSFSATGNGKEKVGRLLSKVKLIVEDEGFEVHPKKTRIQRKGRLQEVTGLVVNDELGVPRKTLKKFRALLFQLGKDGPKGKKWGPGADLLSSIEGFANFVSMVHPGKGSALQKAVKSVMKAKGLKKTKAKKKSSTPKKQESSKASVSSPAGSDEIIVECFKEGSKIRARVISPGYNSDWKVQFPRNLREDKARFRVQELKVQGKGKPFYRAAGEITRIDP